MIRLCEVTETVVTRCLDIHARCCKDAVYRDIMGIPMKCGDRGIMLSKKYLVQPNSRESATDRPLVLPSQVLVGGVNTQNNLAPLVSPGFNCRFKVLNEGCSRVHSSIFGIKINFLLVPHRRFALSWWVWAVSGYHH